MVNLTDLFRSVWDANGVGDTVEEAVSCARVLYDLEGKYTDGDHSPWDQDMEDAAITDALERHWWETVGDYLEAAVDGGSLRRGDLFTGGDWLAVFIDGDDAGRWLVDGDYTTTAAVIFRLGFPERQWIPVVHY